jgi:hypothetical protein
MAMTCYFLDRNKTDLMDVDWVKQIRASNEETRKPRKLYQHGDTCLHGKEPESVVQGRGIQGIYWKRCDGHYLNALGQELHIEDLVKESPNQEPLGLELESDPTKLAERAWRAHHPEECEEDEEEQAPKRKLRCIVM